MVNNLTAAKFQEWTANAKSTLGRTAIKYHEGILMRDRVGDERLGELADAVWQAYKEGLVSLSQVRVQRPSPIGTLDENSAEPACGYYAERL